MELVVLSWFAASIGFCLGWAFRTRMAGDGPRDDVIRLDEDRVLERAARHGRSW